MICQRPQATVALTTGILFSFFSSTLAIQVQASSTSAGDAAFQITQTSQTNAILTAEPGSEINVRSGAGTTFSAIHYGVPGDAVVILESNATRGSTDPVWYRLRFVESRAEGWVRADFVLKGSHDPIEDVCHQAIANARTRISDVKNTYLISAGIGVTNSPYSDRTNNLSLKLGGSGHANVMSSPQFMLNISDKIIDACETVSSVGFYTSIASGQHDIFGLVDGAVTQFSCANFGNSRLRWGEMNCGV